MNTDDRKVAFLDTNALHYVDLYLKHAAEGDSMYPFIDREMDHGMDHDNAIEEAKTKLRSVSEKKLKESLGHGLNVLAWISKEKLSVEYSPLTELELMAGRLKGKALLAAAAEGIPDRMWGRFPEDEIAARLTLKDLQEVKTAVDGLGVALEYLEINVAASTERGRDVLDLARHVAGLVYMDAKDCVIYSHALVARADYLITNDGYLKNTVNSITSDPSLQEIKIRLIEMVSQVTLSGSDDVVLPEAKSPKDCRPKGSSSKGSSTS